MRKRLSAAVCAILLVLLSSCGQSAKKSEKAPDTSSSKAESFEKITIEDKAVDVEGAHWERYSFDGGAAVDYVLVTDDRSKSGSILYQADRVTGIDLRGYRKKGCDRDLVISVSPDGENWNRITAGFRSDAAFTEWDWVAYTTESGTVPAQTKWVKIEIPPLAKTAHDLMLCDVQLLYNPE